MKQRDTFGDRLKEKLNDFRAHNISLDEILIFLEVYYLKKLLDLPNERNETNKNRN